MSRTTPTMLLTSFSTRPLSLKGEKSGQGVGGIIVVVDVSSLSLVKRAAVKKVAARKPHAKASTKSSAN